MKVERFYGYNENGTAKSVTIRILRTTCPLCKQAVEFAMTEKDFTAEENCYLKKQNDRFRDEIARLNSIIDNLIMIKR